MGEGHRWDPTLGRFSSSENHQSSQSMHFLNLLNDETEEWMRVAADEIRTRDTVDTATKAASLSIEPWPVELHS